MIKKKILLICLSIIASLLISEFILGQLELLNNNNIDIQLLRYNNCFEQDPDTGYKLKVNHKGYCLTDEYGYRTYTNSDALRSNSRSKSIGQKNDHVRILFLGDSFTFGTGVDYPRTFPYLVEKTLGKSKFKAINAGVPGYNMGNYVEYYKKYGKGFNPDLVVVSICIANDIVSGLTVPDITEEGYLGKRFKVNYALSLWNKVHYKLFKKSALYRSISRLGIDFSSPGSIGKENPDFKENSLFWMSKEKTNSIAGQQLFNGFFESSYKMISELKSDKVKYIFVLLPYREQINIESLQNYSGSSRLNIEELDSLLPQKTLTAFFKQNKIQYLDLYTYFMEAKKTGLKLFFDIDGHFTRSGNEIAALAISEYIKSQFDFDK